MSDLETIKKQITALAAEHEARADEHAAQAAQEMAQAQRLRELAAMVERHASRGTSGV